MAEATNAGIDSVDGEPLCLGNTAALIAEKQEKVEHFIGDYIYISEIL